MYRKSLEKNMTNVENMSLMDIQFLNRVCQLPLVTASWGQLAAIYSQAKESNRLLKFTLDKAEWGVAGVASTAAPLVNKLEKPITILDGIACGQLDKLQERYPIINKPADVWISKSQDMYGNSLLKPSVDKVLSVKDMGVEGCAKVYDVTVKPSLETYSRAKNYATEKGAATYNAVYNVTVGPAMNLGVLTFSTAKDYSVGTVQAASQYSKNKMTNVMNYGTGKFGEAMGTQYGKMLQSRMDDLLEKADQYVDYYLPEPESGEQEKKIEIDAVETETTMTKACHVTTKARRRMYHKAMTDLNNLKLRTREAIDNLKHTIDLIQYDKVVGTLSDAKTVTVDGARFASDKLKFYWEEMNKTGEEVESKEGDGNQVERMSVEMRLLATARHLTQQIKLGVATVSTTASSLLSASVLDHAVNAKKYTQDLYNSFAAASSLNDLSHTVLDQAKEKLDYLTHALNFATDYVINTINVDWLIKWRSSLLEKEKIKAEAKVQTENVQASEPKPSTTNEWETSKVRHNGSSPATDVTHDQQENGRNE